MRDFLLAFSKNYAIIKTMWYVLEPYVMAVLISIITGIATLLAVILLAWLIQVIL